MIESESRMDVDDRIRTVNECALQVECAVESGLAKNLIVCIDMNLALIKRDPSHRSIYLGRKALLLFLFVKTFCISLGLPSAILAENTEPVPYVKDDGKWGYADVDKHLVIPCVYDEATPFREGLAAVKKGEKWGFIDARGRQAVVLQYDWVKPFSEGLAAVGVNTDRETGVYTGVGKYKKPVFETKWGFIDPKGNVVIPLEHFTVLPFQNGVARVQSGPTILTLRWGLIDALGKWIVPPEKYVMAWNFSEGLAPVYERDDTEGQAFGFVDQKGNLVIPILKYSGGGEIWKDGRFLVSFNGKWGFIDSSGREVIPAQFDEASYFYEGRARVKQNGKVGFIDTSGHAVIPLQYEDAGNFDAGGLAGVKMGAKQSFIDRDGAVIIPPLFDWNLSQICDDGIYHEGLRKIILDGKYGFIDNAGKIVITPQYRYAWSFSEGLAGVEQEGKWGFIDRTGKVTIPFKYFRIDSKFENGFARVTVKLPWDRWIHGYIDKKGNEFFERPKES